jgi:hypothetical protein
MPCQPKRSRSSPLQLALLLFFLLLIVALSGCGGRGIGWGVLLWSPFEEMVNSGSVVRVASESDLNDIYVIEHESLEEPEEIDRWRVSLFSSSEEATTAADAYSESLDGNARLYASAERNALPMRSEPDSLANNIVYRLREGETMKLVGRQSEQTNVEGLVSYWYEALTETGVRAWVFGYTLRVFDPLDETIVIESGQGDDPLMDLLLQNIWRPIYFVDMIANGAIDLELFKPEYGLFPDPEQNRLKLVLRRHSVVFDYNEIVNVGPRKYLAEGTSLQMTFQRNDELSLQYLVDGQQFVLAMQRVAGDVNDYVEAELARRSAAYERLLEQGPAFSSDNYGHIKFLEDQHFTWDGYSRLVPAAISEGSGNSGVVDLGLFLSAELMPSYDGAISFLFSSGREAVRFIYVFRGDGIRMVYVPENDINDRVVLRESLNPLTLFFSSNP